MGCPQSECTRLLLAASSGNKAIFSEKFDYKGGEFAHSLSTRTSLNTREKLRTLNTAKSPCNAS